MTKTFLLVTLTDKQTLTFGDPILIWIKENFPLVQVLDVDAYSDDILISQACTLIKESRLAVIFFKVLTPQSTLGSSIKLLEAILQNQEKGYVFLSGNHILVENIVADRAQVSFKKIENPTALKENLSKVLG